MNRAAQTIAEAALRREAARRAHRAIVPPDMVLTDSRGHEWRAAPGYQDNAPNAPGWLLLRSDLGEELPFAEVLMIRGVQTDGTWRLEVRLDADESAS